MFDKNGNLTIDAENCSFVFNADNKQREIRDSSSNLVGEYFYDGEGKRVKKNTYDNGVLEETTVFVYSSGKLIAEYSSKPPAQSPTTSFTITDQLGSPRVLVNTLGQVVSRRDFMPFGEELGAGVGPRTQNLKYSYLGSDNIRQRFTGYEKDDETGLDFAEARMYQNKHGRFTAPDPLLASASSTKPQTLNRYTYTGNNPMNIIDPTGLKWVQRSNGSVDWEKDEYELGAEEKDVTAEYSGRWRECSSPCGANGSDYFKGDVVYFGENGQIQAVRGSDAAQIAAATGTEVRATMEEIGATGASIITDFGAGVIQGIAGSACMGNVKH